jgi:ABC-2 type transport system ATP-binding protein
MIVTASTNSSTRYEAPAQSESRRSVLRQPLLQIENLTKRYGQHTALDSISFSVCAGEVFGYIGPNGAGKTTTFRILAGLLQPTSGQVLINGQSATGRSRTIKSLVGYLPDNFGVYPTLRVCEYLDFFAAAYRIPRKRRAERIDECLRIANASEFREKLMSALSRGMKQRVGIAKTLLHDPQVLILDEPAATLDPRARVQMRQLLRDLGALGKAVLVSSHILPELSDVCDSVAILDAGRIVRSGPVQEILRTVRQTRVFEIRTLPGFRDLAIAALDSAPGEWNQLDQQIPEAATSDLLRYEVRADERQLADALELLISRGVRLASFSELPPDLEDVFMTLTQ